MTISPHDFGTGNAVSDRVLGKRAYTFLKENYSAYDIFKFEFTDEEMQTIKEMDAEHGNFYLRG